MIFGRNGVKHETDIICWYHLCSLLHYCRLQCVNFVELLNLSSFRQEHGRNYVSCSVALLHFADKVKRLIDMDTCWLDFSYKWDCFVRDTDLWSFPLVLKLQHERAPARHLLCWNDTEVIFCLEEIESCIMCPHRTFKVLSNSVISSRCRNLLCFCSAVGCLSKKLKYR